MDIVFGDCVALGGHCYALILVYETTRYFWLYDMSSLSSTSITSVLKKFKPEAVQLTKRFHANFYRKLIGRNVLR